MILEYAAPLMVVMVAAGWLIVDAADGRQPPHTMGLDFGALAVVLALFGRHK